MWDKRPKSSRIACHAVYWRQMFSTLTFETTLWSSKGEISKLIPPRMCDDTAGTQNVAYFCLLQRSNTFSASCSQLSELCDPRLRTRRMIKTATSGLSSAASSVTEQLSKLSLPVGQQNTGPWLLELLLYLCRLLLFQLYLISHVSAFYC